MDILLSNIVSRIVGDDHPNVVEAVGEIIKRDLGTEYSWPGNVREFEQAVKSALLSHAYSPDAEMGANEFQDRLITGIDKGDVTLEELSGWYCALLYSRHGNYEEAAKRAGIDWRTLRKHTKAALEKVSEEEGVDLDILGSLKKMISNI